MICNQCGKENRIQARFCAFCGAAMEQEAVAAETPEIAQEAAVTELPEVAQEAAATELPEIAQEMARIEVSEIAWEDAAVGAESAQEERPELDAQEDEAAAAPEQVAQEDMPAGPDGEDAYDETVIVEPTEVPDEEHPDGKELPDGVMADAETADQVAGGKSADKRTIPLAVKIAVPAAVAILAIVVGAAVYVTRRSATDADTEAVVAEATETAESDAGSTEAQEAATEAEDEADAASTEEAVEGSTENGETDAEAAEESTEAAETDAETDEATSGSEKDSKEETVATDKAKGDKAQEESATKEQEAKAQAEADKKAQEEAAAKAKAEAQAKAEADAAAAQAQQNIQAVEDSYRSQFRNSVIPAIARKSFTTMRGQTSGYAVGDTFTVKATPKTTFTSDGYVLSAREQEYTIREDDVSKYLEATDSYDLSALNQQFDDYVEAQMNSHMGEWLWNTPFEVEGLLEEYGSAQAYLNSVDQIQCVQTYLACIKDEYENEISGNDTDGNRNEVQRNRYFRLYRIDYTATTSENGGGKASSKVTYVLLYGDDVAHNADGSFVWAGKDNSVGREIYTDSQINDYDQVVARNVTSMKEKYNITELSDASGE